VRLCPENRHLPQDSHHCYSLIEFIQQLPYSHQVGISDFLNKGDVITTQNLGDRATVAEQGWGSVDTPTTYCLPPRALGPVYSQDPQRATTAAS
jgi:hypothetical protein